MMGCRQWIGPDTIGHAGEVCITSRDICYRISQFSQKGGPSQRCPESHVGDIEFIDPGEAPLAPEPVGDRQ